jgi:molybdenum cofactor cytidylyltransferase
MEKGISLSRALGAGCGDVISFVGGGGKTTSMFKLASELQSAGLKVITTTTTHISVEQAESARCTLQLEQLSSLKDRLNEFGHCLLIGLPDGKGRVHGAAPELVDQLHENSIADVILVEADGSRSRPFKAPGNYEPVVPPSTTILAPVVGMNIIGSTLDEDHVHRAEIVASLTNQALGSIIAPETVASILCHPEGGAKKLPPGARLIPILNKTDSEKDISNARAIAKILITRPIVSAVALCSVIHSIPVHELWSRRDHE